MAIKDIDISSYDPLGEDIPETELDLSGSTTRDDIEDNPPLNDDDDKDDDDKDDDDKDDDDKDDDDKDDDDKDDDDKDDDDKDDDDKDDDDKDDDDKDDDDKDDDDKDDDDKDDDDKDDDDKDDDNDDDDETQDYVIKHMTFVLNDIYQGNETLMKKGEFNWIFKNDNYIDASSYVTTPFSEYVLKWNAKMELEYVIEKDEIERLDPQIRQDTMASIAQVDEMLVEYLILNMKNNQRYYDYDGFEKYLYDHSLSTIEDIWKNNKYLVIETEDSDRYSISSFGYEHKSILISYFGHGSKHTHTCMLIIDDIAKKILIQHRNIDIEFAQRRALNIAKRCFLETEGNETTDVGERGQVQRFSLLYGYLKLMD